MVEFSFSVSVRVVDSIIDQPELVDSKVNVNIGYKANAFDNSLTVPAVLVSDQFNLRAIALIRYRIIENYVTLVTCNNIFFRISPN